MEKMNDLKDLLKHEIDDLYSVEEQILEALPKMIDKAEDSNLKNALSGHLSITKQQKGRLEKIRQSLEEGEESGKKKGFLAGLFGGKHHCKGMAGIIEEGNKIMNADISPEARDAAIIASAQKVEHYEICGYGTAKSFAQELGLEQIARQLGQTLNEEYEADLILTQLAEERVNREAESPSEGAASGSSKGRSAGRVKEKANREEREMEPVSSHRERSSGRNSSSGSAKSSGSNSRKPSGSSRSETGGRGSNSSKKSTAGGRNSSRSNGRSSSGGRGSSTGRGRR